jgi:hypothetical protein
MALALTSFGSLRAPNLLPADLSAPGHHFIQRLTAGYSAAVFRHVSLSRHMKKIE